MKEIALSGKNGIGKFALVDDEDFEYLNQWKWICNHHGYVIRTIHLPRNGEKQRNKTISMHSLLNKPPEGMFTDHISGDRLDNRRSNLRNATPSQNVMNITKTWGKSKYKGVAWHKGGKKWCGTISVNNKRKWLGLFNTEEDAALAYNSAARQFFGEFAALNELIGGE